MNLVDLGKFNGRRLYTALSFDYGLRLWTATSASRASSTVAEFLVLTRKCGNYSTDVLPLKAARRDAIANLRCFWGFGHQIPNFDGYIYIHYVAPPYSARISVIYFLPFDNVRLGLVSACNAWEAQCRIRRVGKNSDPILSRFGPKFMKLSDDMGSPLCFPTPFSDCLCHVPFRRYSPLSLEVVEKRSKCKSFLAPSFVGGTAPTFLRHFVRATYYPLLGKVW